MTETTKTFPTAEVLSATVGVLIVGDIGRVYGVLNFMTGETLFTHQLPRAGREACAALLKDYPDLALTIAEKDQVNHSNWQEWRDKWIARHGPTMTVRRMTADEHESREPLSELAEHVHPSKIIVVKNQ